MIAKSKRRARAGHPSANQALKRVDWVPFCQAHRLLDQRFQCSAGEIAMWIFFGADAGGLDGYLDAPMHEGSEPTDLATLPRCSFDELKDETELLPHLMRAYFDRAALDRFSSDERYITYKQAVALLLPFAGDDSLAQALIRARTITGELDGLHPITVVTQHTHGHGNDPAYAPLEQGMFKKSAIERLIDSTFPDRKTTYLTTETTSQRDQRLQARAEELFAEGLRQNPSKRHSKNYVCTQLADEEKAQSGVTFDRLVRVIKKPKSSSRRPTPALGPNVFGAKP